MLHGLGKLGLLRFLFWELLTLGAGQEDTEAGGLLCVAGSAMLEQSNHSSARQAKSACLYELLVLH